MALQSNLPVNQQLSGCTSLKDIAATGELISKNPKIKEICELIDQIADTSATVLITGESGAGKELIARALHEKSARAQKPFIAVNCSAISEHLQESELFGHAKGAFTGAARRKVGKFEAAAGGTIFLDEISEMAHSLQVKLLRILQSGEYAPVGVAKNQYCSARIVAATNQDLVPLVAEGRFRHDLYYRLNIIRLNIPPLRDRMDDLPLLIDQFIESFCRMYHKERLRCSPEFVEKLAQYDYPGNVRELQNIIQRAVIFCRDSYLSVEHLPVELRHCRRPETVTADMNFHQAKADAIERFERKYLNDILARTGGIISRAAKLSGLSERNFHGKLKKYGMCGKDFRSTRKQKSA